jgi:2-polyprenyl-3-methyl-5-hydroxy-6-metoxy-1,4-benzoquinol methylase
LLDYGCGTGEFMRVATLNNWAAQGVEPSNTARIHASEIIKDSIAQSLDEVSPNIRFDVITLWHVLEHVPDLDKTIQKLKLMLADNGTIFIAVPNHLSWDGKKYKGNWAGYDVPRHLWHFSKQNIKMLLEKNQMKLVKTLPMRLDAFYICLLSEKYAAKGTLTLSRICKALLNGIRSNLAAANDGESSSVIFIARK